MNQLLIFLNDNIACLNSILPVTRLLSLFRSITKDGRTTEPLSVTVVKVINLDVDRCSSVIKVANVEATLNNDPALSTMRAYAEMQEYFSVKIFGLLSTNGDNAIADELDSIVKSERFDIIILPLNMDAEPCSASKFPKAYCRLADEAKNTDHQILAVFANRSTFLATKNPQKNVLALTTSDAGDRVTKMLDILSTSTNISTNVFDNQLSAPTDSAAGGRRNFEFPTASNNVDLVLKICTDKQYDLIILSMDWYKDNNITIGNIDDRNSRSCFKRFIERIRKMFIRKLCCFCSTTTTKVDSGEDKFLVGKTGRSNNNCKYKDVADILNNFVRKLPAKTSALIVL